MGKRTVRGTSDARKGPRTLYTSICATKMRAQSWGQGLKTKSLSELAPTTYGLPPRLLAYHWRW